MAEYRYVAQPNIPPIGLREVEPRCIVCEQALPFSQGRHPLRLQFVRNGEQMTRIVVGYSCRSCRSERHDEVRKAHMRTVGCYLHITRVPA